MEYKRCYLEDDSTLFVEDIESSTLTIQYLRGTDLFPFLEQAVLNTILRTVYKNHICNHLSMKFCTE